MAFVQLTIDPPPFEIEAWLTRTMAKLVVFGDVAIHEVANKTADDLMPKLRSGTPVDTGALMDQTDYTRETTPEGERLTFFSTAQNIRTGYEYAHARAYGFTTRNGEFWTPPEVPPYPMQAVMSLDPSHAGIYVIPGGI